jgi:hypothetical protein
MPVDNETLGRLAQEFNRKVDDLYGQDISNLGVSHDFWKYIEPAQERKLYLTTLTEGGGPKDMTADDHIARAEIRAEVLSRIHRGTHQREMRDYCLPKEARGNDEVAAAFESKPAPTLARLCR